MCCGTHVNNLSDIQCIKLLQTETKKGLTLLYYVAGNRVLHYLGKCFQTEKGLTKLLRCGNCIVIVILMHVTMLTISCERLFFKPALE